MIIFDLTEKYEFHEIIVISNIFYIPLIFDF